MVKTDFTIRIPDIITKCGQLAPSNPIQSGNKKGLQYTSHSEGHTFEIHWNKQFQERDTIV